MGKKNFQSQQLFCNPPLFNIIYCMCLSNKEVLQLHYSVFLFPIYTRSGNLLHCVDWPLLLVITLCPHLSKYLIKNERSSSILSYIAALIRSVFHRHSTEISWFMLLLTIEKFSIKPLNWMKFITPFTLLPWDDPQIVHTCCMCDNICTNRLERTLNRL